MSFEKISEDKEKKVENEPVLSGTFERTDNFKTFSVSSNDVEIERVRKELASVEGKSNLNDSSLLPNVQIKKELRKNNSYSKLKKFVRIVLVALTTLIGSDKTNKERYNIEKIEDDIGLNLKDLEKDTDTKISVEVYSPEANKYLIHLGQIHYAPDMEKIAPEEVKKVIESQKKIEIILEKISSLNDGVIDVFSEGISSENLRQIESLKKDADKISTIEKDKCCYKNIYDILLRDLKFINVHSDTLRAYIIDKKISSLGDFSEEDLSQMSQEEKKDFYFYKRQLVTFRDNSEEKIGSDSIYFYLGGTFKAYFDGIINLLSSEGRSYEKNTEKGILIKDRNQSVRENETLNIIINNEDGKTQKIIPLVFGDLHDFSRIISNYNSSHLSDKMNLIKIDTE